MIPSPASHQRLQALGIDVWVRRDRRAAASRLPEVEQADETPSRLGPETPRVRMASGDGDWLLVQDAPWDGRHETLLGDIQAAIGSARCRFGQWAHSDSAGVSVAELDSRGIRHLLVFGRAPDGTDGVGVILAPELPQLATSAEARRHLWRLLAAELDD
ncbi:hypothetical protein [Wenzhouxiangella sp. EGI_FJ10305]|uniref:hypothetical protein n=1 Tax=Wenzhouxiangella sp. EGI_FJ10305 TaxID=3243768 RepID=UPI0035E1C4D7